MAQELLKILGQSRPAINTEVVVYSVPKGARAAISRVYIFNNSGGPAIIDLSIVPGGSNNISGNATALENTLLNQVTLATKTGNTDVTNVAGSGFTLDEFDDIRFETDTVGVVAHVYGVEVIPEKT